MTLNIQEYKLEPAYVLKDKVWFKITPAERTHLIIESDKQGLTIYFIQNGELKERIPINPPVNCNNTAIQITINDAKIDICQSIEKVINGFEEYIKQWTLIQQARAGDILGIIPKLPSDWEAMITALAKMVLGERIIKTFYTSEGSREVIIGVFCYENNYYKKCEEWLKKEINDMTASNPILEARATPQMVGQVLKKIEMSTMTPFEPLKKCLLFKNKIFCWDKFVQTKNIEESLIDPSPDLIVVHRIPWEIRPEIYKQAREGILKYIPPKNKQELIELFKTLAPKSFKAFYDWVRRVEDSEETTLERVVLLLEIIGYTLYPHEYPFHKAFMLVGNGSNGKSTFLRLITTILGEENVSNVNLSYLDPHVNRFAGAQLFNKLANLSSEPITARTFNPSFFKMATGEDRMFVEQKFREGFSMFNYAKQVFSANELPEVSEDTKAFWDRWIIIDFTNTFPKDNTWFPRTFTQEEIEAIIICSIFAFGLVLERKDFSSSGVDVKETWLGRSNPVYRVMKKMLEDGLIALDQDGIVIKKDLYELYKRYVDKMAEEDENIIRVDQKDFTRHITRFFPIRAGVPRVMGKSVNAYIGVKIKDYDKALELVGHLETPRPMEEWFK